MKKNLLALMTTTSILLFSVSGQAIDWHDTEIQFQYGTLDIPTFAGGGDEDVSIFTFQHANGWKYGGNFIFVDFIDSNERGSDIYTEYYGSLSFGKMRGKPVGFGKVNDVAFIFGLNYADNAKVLKYLPGIRFSFDTQNFAFLNLDITAYIDDSKGVARGGAPKEDDSFMVDVNWKYPFIVGQQNWSIEGHMEYIGERDNEFGQEVSGHFLAQPQVRWDAGKTWWDAEDKFHLGVEFQWWENKLGDKATDEFATQFLAVYNF